MTEKEKQIKEKIDEGVVVLARGNLTDLLNQETRELQISLQTRKETAKEILQKVGKVCGDYQWFKNLCKQYGVEVDE